MRKTLTVISLAVVLHLAPVSIGAQEVPFLSELLFRFESFNKAYNEKKRAGANLAAIDALRVKGEAAFKSGNVRAIFEALSEAMAALEGHPWDDRRKFIDSLSLEINKVVLEPNQNLQVTLSRMFPSDPGKAFTETPAVTIEVIRRGDAPASRSSITSPQKMPTRPIIAEKLSIGEATTLVEKRLLLPDGVYSVVARIHAGNRLITEIQKPLYAVSNFSERISELTALLDQAKKSTNPQVKALSHVLQTPEFQLQRLASLNSRRAEVEIDPFAELDRLEAVISALAKGADPYAGVRGEIERAYLASDGKLIPYRVYIPASHDGTKSLPLAVLLHGALGDESTYFSNLYDAALVKGEAERRGFVLAAPNGRGRLGGYRGLGEDDVFEVIKAVTRDHKIDSSRIYVTGHSMGAFAAWSVAARQPDLFAAIAPVSGGSPVAPEALPALLEKVKSIPALVVHGARDGIVPPQSSRSIVEAAKKKGLKIDHIEAPAEDHISVVAATFPQVMNFFDLHKKPAVK